MGSRGAVRSGEARARTAAPRPSAAFPSRHPLCPSSLCGGMAWLGTTEARGTQREVGGADAEPTDEEPRR